MTEALALPAANPFSKIWETPFGLAPFAEITPEHFAPAIRAGLVAHAAEIEAIAGSGDAPTLDNTLLALERAADGLSRVLGVFYNLAGADTNDALQGLEREFAPVLSRHWTAITMNERLFARLDAVHAERASLNLDAETLRLLERKHASFVRNGARLKGEARARLGAINERLSMLGTRFSQNLLKDESDYALVLAHPDDLAGLPDWLVAAMSRAASDRGHVGNHIVTLSRSIIEPFLTFSTRRDLRATAFAAWAARGENGGETDNRTIVAETVRLRVEKAKLLGFASFADFKLEDTMAKKPDAVADLLGLVWKPAKARAAREAADLIEVAKADGLNAIAPHDWRHYAEKVRQARHRIDEAEIKPYLVLDNIIAAAFDVATRLFGLQVKARADLKAYHPDVRVFEISDAVGAHVGLFLGDYYARASKRSGAWMSQFRGQLKLDVPRRPIIVNVCNFAKPADGEPALLSFDDARTLFHEFGHALHGLMSDVTYPSLAGTSVSRDFVELPSQLYEHWFMTTEVLSRFAKHAETGEPMPKALIDKVLAARNFNQGFATIEYTSSALVDLAFHRLEDVTDDFDPLAFEAGVLRDIGMPTEITMRHRTPQFAHVFSGDGYSAGYYSYLWSEVMDADAFNAFLEAGDVFAPEVAAKLKTFIYAAGNSRDPAEAYTLFRGRMPTPQALLEKRGLAA
jgi:peptidyl-dipeptidase Dcp